MSHEYAVKDLLRLPLPNLGSILESMPHGQLDHLSQGTAVATDVTLLLLRVDEALISGATEVALRLVKWLEASTARLSESEAKQVSQVALLSVEVPQRVCDLLSMSQQAIRVPSTTDATRANLAAVTSYLLDALAPFVDAETNPTHALAIKETFGSVLLPSVLLDGLLQFSGQEEFNTVPELVRVRRSYAVFILELVKQSKKNKETPPSWSPVVQSLLHSRDILHQLQCVEILFRVTRMPKDKAIRSHPLLVPRRDFVALPEDVRRAIAELPSSNELTVGKMLDVCLLLNAPRIQKAELVVFSVTSLLLPAKTLTQPGHVFVTAEQMILIFGELTRTVQLSCIGSVKMTKGGHLVCRLDRIPEDFVQVLSTEKPGDDQFSLVLSTAEDLTRLKSTPVARWISAAQAAWRAGGRVAKRGRGETGEGGVGAAAAVRTLYHRSDLPEGLRPTELFPATENGASPAAAAANGALDRSPTNFVGTPEPSKVAAALSTVAQEEVQAVMQAIRRNMEAAQAENIASAQRVVEELLTRVQTAVDAMRSETTELVADAQRQGDEGIEQLKAAAADARGSLDELVKTTAQEELHKLKAEYDAFRSALTIAEMGLSTFVEDDREESLSEVHHLRSFAETKIQQWMREP